MLWAILYDAGSPASAIASQPIPWPAGWEMITGISTAVLACATTILVVLAARQIPALYRAAAAGAEAAKLQAEILRLERDPVIILEPLTQEEGSRENIVGWYFVRGAGGSVADCMESSDLLTTVRRDGSAVYAPWESDVASRFTVVKIKNLGRSAAINARIELRISWGSVTVVPGDPPDIKGVTREALAKIRIPSVGPQGFICVGFSNMTGLRANVTASGVATDDGTQGEPRAFSAASPEPIVLWPRG